MRRGGFLSALGLLSLIAPRERDPLDHELRRRILAFLKSREGVTVTTLGQELSASWSTLALHVKGLESEGLLFSTKVGRRRLIFAAAPASEVASALALLQEEPALRIARYILDRGEVSRSQIQTELGLSERSMYNSLQKMHEGGLLQSTGSTKYHRLAPTALLVAALPRE